MPNFDLGSAEGKIVIDASGVDKGVDQANQSLGRLGKGSGNTAGALQAVGGSMLGVGTIAVGAFGLAVKSAADFESQISGIEAVSQGTEEQMERVRQKALKLGADTKFSAGEAAGAIEELSRKGIDLEDVLGGAADAVVNLSAATGTQLETSATIAANAMNVFGIDAKDLDRVVNQIAGFDVVGSSVEDFGMALTQSGAVADLVGLSFEDLTVAIAAMSKAGINSSDAGTSIKTFLNNLQPTTEKQIALAKELGIVTEDGTNNFYDQNGQLKSMQEVAGVLSGAVSGLTDQQKQLALETLFGSDAIRAAAVIAEQGAPGFAALSAQIGEVDAGEQAAIRMDNLSGSIEQLKGSVETYLIAAGTPFLDSVRSIIDALTGLVNFFGGLPAPVQKMIGQFVLFGGALFLVAGAGSFFLGTFIKFAGNISTIFKAVGGLTKAFQLLNLTLLANPIVLIVLALIALGVAFFIAYKKSEKFREFINGLGEDIKRIWNAIVDFFEQLPEHFQAMWNKVKDVFNGVLDFITGWIDNFKEIFSVLFKGDFLGIGKWQEDAPFIGKLLNIREAILDFVDAIKAIPGQIVGALDTAKDAVIDFAVQLPKRMLKALLDVLRAVGNFVKQLPEKIAYGLGLAIGKFIKFHIELEKRWIKLWIDVIKTVITWLTKLPGIVQDFLTKALNMVIDFGRMVVENNIRFWTQLVQDAINKLTEFVTWLPGFVAQTFAFFYNLGVRLISWAASSFSSLLATIVSFVSQIPGKVGSYFLTLISNLPGYAATIFSKALDIGKNLVNGVVQGIGDLVGLIKGMVLGAINGVSDLGTTAYNKMKSLGESMWNGFKKGLFGSPHTKVEYAVWAMTDNVDASIKTLATQVRDLNGLAMAMPGMGRSDQGPGNVGALALSAGTQPLVGSQASSAAGSVYNQNAPLIGQATIRDEGDVEMLARRLDDLRRGKLAAAGRREVVGTGVAG